MKNAGRTSHKARPDRGPIRARLNFLFACATALLVVKGAAASGEYRPQRIVKLDPDCEIHFLAGESAAAAIVEDKADPFFRLLSQIDGELRLRRSLDGALRDVWIAELKDQYRRSVRSWSDAEIEAVAAACRHVLARANAVAPAFVPRPWKFIKTDGEEESGAAYTRHDAIILPANRLERVAGAAANPGSNLNRLVAHETAHVYSRLHAAPRDRLYARLGFRPVGPIELGAWLAERRCTNPDGSQFEHVIEISNPEFGEISAVLVTYSKSSRFNPQSPERMFAYLRYGLFPAERTASGWRIRQGTNGQPLGPWMPNQATGFFEKVGNNTRYLIHPDEILADNLAILFGGAAADVENRPPADRLLLHDLASTMAAALEN